MADITVQRASEDYQEISRNDNVPVDFLLFLWPNLLRSQDEMRGGGKTCPDLITGILVGQRCKMIC